MGRQTYMARFDAQGRLLRIDQVLQVSNVQALTVGVSTREDVRDLFGRPGYVTLKNFQGHESWDYFAKDGPRRIIIGVTFDPNGRVLAAGEVADPEEFSPGRGRR
jgi:outer membrane protein assembly factor BamE (lipoprotein component of BamABCDE complex)